jgi:hypothetical protein
MTHSDESSPGYWDGVPLMQERTAIEWLMATNDGTGVDSWHWLAESSTTSFYVKAMHHALEGAKVSLHGPDDNHPGGGHFRFDLIRTDGETLDQQVADKAARAGGRWLTDPNELPFYFSGRHINDDVKHVVRVSTAWDAFTAGAEPAGPSRMPKAKADMRVFIPVPREGHVRHVDLYLSTNGEPYWPHGEQAIRAAGAGIGYLTNSLGWTLSAVSMDHEATEETDPVGSGFRGDRPLSECSRGRVTWVDETGLLWLFETLIAAPPRTNG